MEDFLDIHTDEDIYVICSGKSCDYIDPSFFDNKITIGINQVYKRFNCKYYMRKEIKYTSQVIESIDKDSILFITKGDCGSAHGVHGERNKKYIDKNHKNNKNIIICDNYQNIRCQEVQILPKHFCKDNIKINKLITSKSTITTGIHLAYYMGAKNIILVGHDCCLIDNESNFTNYHTKQTLSYANGGTQRGYNKFLLKIENQTIYIKNLLKKHFSVNVCSLNPFINLNLEGHKHSRTILKKNLLKKNKEPTKKEHIVSKTLTSIVEDLSKKEDSTKLIVDTITETVLNAVTTVLQEVAVEEECIDRAYINKLNELALKTISEDTIFLTEDADNDYMSYPRILVVSTTHASNSNGCYFNFHIETIDDAYTYNDKPFECNEVFYAKQIRNDICIKEGMVILWRKTNPPTQKGLGHGRWNKNYKVNDWKEGDQIIFV